MRSCGTKSRKISLSKNNGLTLSQKMSCFKNVSWSIKKGLKYTKKQLCSCVKCIITLLCFYIITLLLYATLPYFDLETWLGFYINYFNITFYMKYDLFRPHLEPCALLLVYACTRYKFDLAVSILTAVWLNALVVHTFTTGTTPS